MARVTTQQIWTDGRGIRHDVDDMADDYIMNCICFLQRRVDLLNNTGYGSAAIDNEIAACEESIEMFVSEMDYRTENNITITRNELEL